MKRFTAIALVMLAGFCTAGRLQAQDREAQASIPFNFIVGSKQLPAGTYRFSKDGDNILVIRNRERPICILTMIADVTHERDGSGRVIFHKYGDRYFLSEIHGVANALNGEISRSKLEKQAQSALQASLQPESVLVAAE